MRYSATLTAHKQARIGEVYASANAWAGSEWGAGPLRSDMQYFAAAHMQDSLCRVVTALKVFTILFFKLTDPFLFTNFTSARIRSLPSSAEVYPSVPQLLRAWLFTQTQPIIVFREPASPPIVTRFRSPIGRSQGRYYQYQQ